MIAAQPVTAQYFGSATARILSSTLATSVWEMQFEFRVPPLRRSPPFDNAAAVALNSIAEPDLMPDYVRAVWVDVLPLAASFPAGLAAGAFDMAPTALSMMSAPHAGDTP